MAHVTSEMKRCYDERGYLVIPDVIEPDLLEELQRTTDEFVERSRSLTEDAEGMELAPGHSSADPRLRRLNFPQGRHAVYADLIRHAGILEAVTAIVGPDVRHHHSKLTLKLARHGEAVEWHQDWAFYPHTNDAMLEVGVCIDAIDEENGPLMVIPGSHRGPIHDHHVDGTFYGAVAAGALQDLLPTAVPMVAPAGGITIHHVRMLHGSGPNRSHRARRFLLMGYNAADAWPLSGYSSVDPSYYEGALVAGSAAPTARMEQLPVRLPIPLPPTTSLYEIQKAHPDRVYEPAT